MPIGLLKKVGVVYVPNGNPRWSFAPKREITIAKSEDVSATSPKALRERIDYDRVETITGTIYVAVVYTEIKAIYQ